MATVPITLTGVSEARLERLKTAIKTHLQRFGVEMKVAVVGDDDGNKKKGGR